MVDTPFTVSESSLYYPLASFIGPVHQLAEVKELLTTSRLLTLIGVGGCGKTRLAYEVVSNLSEEFEHGKWWIDLTTLDDPALVLQAVTSVPGLFGSSNDSLIDLLLDFLRPKDLLLVLDGCEHLITVCAQLIETLLHACPNLHILVTSRELLRVTGEVVWQVPLLELPTSHDLPPLAELMHYTAIQLFMERATAVLPTFVLTNENMKAVVQICRRLDSLPLAIELAAARMNVLSIEQIAHRLDDYRSLLTRGSRIALPRHQTLQANIDWSYRLLSGKEQELFRRFSVFGGGFTLEAAETVCAFRGIERAEVLELLSQLVDKSLVMVEMRSNKARYRLLGTICQYAQNRLQEAGEEIAMRNRLRDWCLDLVERVSLELAGSWQTTWIDRLKVEYDNLMAMLQWTIQQDETEKTAQLYKALRQFGLFYDQGEEHQRIREAVEECIGYLVAQAKVLERIDGLAVHTKNYAQAHIRLYESLEQLHKPEGKGASAQTRSGLATLTSKQGDMLAFTMAPKELTAGVCDRAPARKEQPSPPVVEKIMSLKVKTPLELRVFALRPIQIYQGKHLISPADRMYAKAREMLFYLLCHRFSTKEQIGLALWPDISLNQLRGSFHSTLHLLRRALGQGEWIIFEDGRYSFNWQLPYWFDVEAFETSITQAQKLQLQAPRQAISYLEEAVKWYQADFLHDIPNGTWYLPRQQELRRIYLDALLTLGQLLHKEELYLRAIDIYHQAIVHDQFLESAHRELMRCYACLGERSQALRHYQKLVTLIYSEFGVPPAPETQALFERLRQGENGTAY